MHIGEVSTVSVDCLFVWSRISLIRADSGGDGARGSWGCGWSCGVEVEVEVNANVDHMAMSVTFLLSAKQQDVPSSELVISPLHNGYLFV